MMTPYQISCVCGIQAFPGQSWFYSRASFCLLNINLQHAKERSTSERKNICGSLFPEFVHMCLGKQYESESIPSPHPAPLVLEVKGTNRWYMRS